MMTETAAAPAPTEITLDPAALADFHDRLGHIEGELPHFATKAEFADLRTEMQTGFADVRAEMQTEFADVRTEMRTGFARVRTEFADVRAEFADVRAEMRTGFAGVRAEFAEVRAEMAQQQADFERQMRLMTWTLAGVMLAGFTALAAFIKLFG